MLSQIKILTQRKFVRNVLVVATGTAGAQIISMAFMTVFTRMYGPEAFGLLGMFMAIIGVLTPMAALTYPLAIVLPKSDEDAKAIVRLSIGIAALMSSLVMFIVLIWGPYLAIYFNAVGITRFLWLIPIAMLFAALHQVVEQLLIRSQQFNVTARVAIVQTLLVNLIKLGAGLLHPVGGVLIIIQSFTQGLSALLLFIGSKGNKLWVWTELNRKKTPVVKVARQYLDFALFRAPEVTINAASQGLPVLMLAAFFGPASAGFYTIALTIMGIPAGLIGKSVGDVFYPRISEAANNGEKLYPLIKKATLLMAAAGFLPFAVVIAFGPWLFTLVFGVEWSVAGNYARWLAVWSFFGLANIPSVKVIPIINAQMFHLTWSITTIFLRLSGLALSYYVFKSDILAVIVFSLIGASVNVYLIIVVFNKCRKFDEFSNCTIAGKVR